MVLGCTWNWSSIDGFSFCILKVLHGSQYLMCCRRCMHSLWYLVHGFAGRIGGIWLYLQGSPLQRAHTNLYFWLVKLFQGTDAGSKANEIKGFSLWSHSHKSLIPCHTKVIFPLKCFYDPFVHCILPQKQLCSLKDEGAVLWLSWGFIALTGIRIATRDQTSANVTKDEPQGLAWAGFHVARKSCRVGIMKKVSPGGFMICFHNSLGFFSTSSGPTGMHQEKGVGVVV